MPRQPAAMWIVVSSILFAFLSAESIAQSLYTIRISADRESAVYDVGDTATISISVWQDDQMVRDKGKLTYSIDDFLNSPTTENATVVVNPPGDEPVQAIVKADKPGFRRCQVSYTPADGKPVRAAMGIGFSPQNIELSLPVPDDFDEFWNKQKQQLAEVPLSPKLTPVKHNSAAIECFDVQTPCAGDAPVSGYFAKPVSAEAKSLPAVLWVHGAGVRSSSLGNAAKGAQAGMLSMDINAHGLPNGRPLSFYAEQSAGALKNYRYAGRESRDTSYFRGMFVRLVRAIDFLTSQPEWNGRHVVVIGHSQGGGQALVAGGLDDRVTMIAVGVPAICDHSGLVADRINGWPRLVPSGTDGLPDAQILEASRYVDAVNFATRCDAEAIMSVGFIDSVCPPSSCYAAYNALKGKKSVINEPSMGHAAPQHIHEAFFDKVLQHVGKASAAVTQ